MVRRSYVVTYDITDNKRRTKVFRLLEGNGDHVQYSVFFCDLSAKELAQLRLDLLPLINHKEDQVLILDMGVAGSVADIKVEAIGRGYNPPCRVVVV